VTRRLRKGPLACLAAAAVACGPTAAERETRAEAATLGRNVQGLRALVSAAEAGTLVTPRTLAVGIEPGVVRDLLSVGLPQEFDLPEGLRLQITSADVNFETAQGLVTLRGRVDRARDPADFADVVCTGGIGSPKVGAEGRLTMPIALDRLEVPRVANGGKDNPLLRHAMDALGQEAIRAVGEGFQAVEIPVHIEPDIPIDGVSQGPVRISGGRIPLAITIAHVVAIAGRLWVLLDVAPGPFEAGKTS
jgi:hypothetical protein